MQTETEVVQFVVVAQKTQKDLTFKNMGYVLVYFEQRHSEQSLVVLF